MALGDVNEHSDEKTINAVMDEAKSLPETAANSDTQGKSKSTMPAIFPGIAAL